MVSNIVVVVKAVGLIWQKSVQSYLAETVNYSLAVTHAPLLTLD